MFFSYLKIFENLLTKYRKLSLFKKNLWVFFSFDFENIKVFLVESYAVLVSLMKF